MDDYTRILLADEIQAVIADLSSRKNKNAAINLVLFRLSCCCGLRRKEICGLNVSDVVPDGPRPFVLIRKDNTKGREGKRKGRKVPLHWDTGTHRAIATWLSQRLGAGALPGDPFVCKSREEYEGDRMKEQAVSRRWFTALKCLGAGRCAQLSIHSGRHSFISHALAAGRSLVEVQRAAGHANVATTSVYLHLIERDDVPDIFGGPQRGDLRNLDSSQTTTERTSRPCSTLSVTESESESESELTTR